MPLMVSPIRPTQFATTTATNDVGAKACTHITSPTAGQVAMTFSGVERGIYHVGGAIAAQTATGAPGTKYENVQLIWKGGTITLDSYDGELDFVVELEGDVQLVVVAADSYIYHFLNIGLTMVARSFEELELSARNLIYRGRL